jgi:hypothetical protein
MELHCEVELFFFGTGDRTVAFEKRLLLECSFVHLERTFDIPAGV